MDPFSIALLAIEALKETAKAVSATMAFLATPAGQKVVERDLATRDAIAAGWDKLTVDVRTGWDRMISDFGKLGGKNGEK